MDMVVFRCGVVGCAGGGECASSRPGAILSGGGDLLAISDCQIWLNCWAKFWASCSVHVILSFVQVEKKVFGFISNISKIFWTWCCWYCMRMFSEAI